MVVEEVGVDQMGVGEMAINRISGRKRKFSHRHVSSYLQPANAIII